MVRRKLLVGTVRVASREAVGFLPESPYFPKYHCQRNAAFLRKLSGRRGKKSEKARVDELLELVGLTSARNRRLGGFSKGMLQRIGLAQALVHEPRLLVLDEPTAGVDPAGSVEIRDPFSIWKRRGITILLRHICSDRCRKFCDRIGILANGVLVREGAVSELLAKWCKIRPSYCSRMPRRNCSSRSQNWQSARARKCLDNARRRQIWKNFSSTRRRKKRPANFPAVYLLKIEVVLENSGGIVAMFVREKFACLRIRLQELLLRRVRPIRQIIASAASERLID